MSTGPLSDPGRRALARIRHCVHLHEHELLGLDDFFSQALPVLAEGLSCDRVSVWTYSQRGPQQALHCERLHHTGHDAAPLPPLVEQQHPDYFRELDRWGILSANDALSHPALHSMREAYLKPNDIHSLLDVPFAVNGRRTGLLCGEQTGAPVEWSAVQISLMRQAGVIGSLFMHRLRRQGRRSDPLRFAS